MQTRFILLVAASLLLAGCAANEDRDGTPTATPTPTDGTTPTPTDGTTPTPTTPTTPTNGGAPPPPAGDYSATIETSKGTIVVALYMDQAPLHASNFLQYAIDGHYDGTVFHRLAKDFVIQGGGFAAPFTGESVPKLTHGPIPVELWDGMTHAEGTLGMARTEDPNSATSQWFINTGDNVNLDAGYTVFGRVLEGMDTVRAIEDVPTTTKGPHQNVPEEDVVIERVTVSVPDTPGEGEVKAFRDAYDVPAGGDVSIPLFVRNVGAQPLAYSLEFTTPEGVTAEVVHDGRFDQLAAGQATTAIVRFAADGGFAGGDVEVHVTSADGETTFDSATVSLETLEASGPVAGDENPKVSARYIGLYDNGVVFDTTAGDLAQRGFPMPFNFQPHTDPLKVWVGNESGDTGGYTPVIEGFKAGIVGLQAGETQTTRLTPEEGYRDGHHRIFEMHVESIDG